jgi:uncharacterized membrane protein
MRSGAATEASRRRLLAVGALLLTSMFGVALVAFRMAYSGTGEYRNLLWNLVLAWVPFLIALAVYDRHRRGVSPGRLALPALVWLLFLPNAPYLVTDLKYLGEIGGAPVWFDVTLLTTFAWLGLLLGFLSLYLMQAVAERVAGTGASWFAALAVLALSGFGIYLGRFERWNSWDVVRDPGTLAGALATGLSDPLDYPRALGVTIALGAFLSLGYLVLYSFPRLAALETDQRR